MTREQEDLVAVLWPWALRFSKRLASRLCQPDWEEAQDVALWAFFRNLLRYDPALTPSPRAFFGFRMRMAIVDHRRAIRHHSQILYDPIYPDPVDNYDAWELLAVLTDRQRRVIAQWMEGHTDREIGEKIGYSATFARNERCAAIRKLKRELA